MQTKYTYKQIWTYSLPYPDQPDYGANDRYDGHCLPRDVWAKSNWEHLPSPVSSTWSSSWLPSVSASGHRYSLPGATANGSIRKSVTCSIRASISKSEWRQSCSCCPIVFSPIILKRIVASEHIYEAATSYLHWRVFGAFFSFSAVMFRAFFLGTTQTKTLTLNSIVMVLSNVVFNYILIFGKFGFPHSALPEPPSAPHWPSWFRCYSSSSIPGAVSTAASTGWTVFRSSGWTY